MATGLKIALVEDNDVFRELLLQDILDAGYPAEGLSSADDLDELSARKSLDILILDINLPGESGLDIARRYKKANPDIYIVMLTARVEVEDKIAGYTSGADIYLTKPVSSSELIAAIGSVSRRLQKSRSETDIVLYLRQMKLVGLVTVEVNRREAIILKALCESENGTLPYYRLIELCGDEASATAKGALEVRMLRLRKKLAEAGMLGDTIRAIRGEGYCLLQPVRIVSWI